MTLTAVLIVAATAQGAFFVALLAFLAQTRWATRRREEQVRDGRRQSQQSLRDWLAGSAPVEAFVSDLSRLPPDAALEFTAELSNSTLDRSAREALSVALRREPWMRSTLGQATSRLWWRRREAARALTIVGAAEDRQMVMRLLNDEHAAVAITAIGVIPRVADVEVVRFVVDRYPDLGSVARGFIATALGGLRTLAAPLIVERLRPEAKPLQLLRWIRLSSDLLLNAALDRAATLGTHPDALVRRAVARALARRPRADSLESLRTLLRDTDSDVRAAAAWAMGQLSNTTAIPDLSRSAYDPVWEVRYQSALALATLGEQGRAVLARIRTDPDKYVADVAIVITGLGDGALLDLVAE